MAEIPLSPALSNRYLALDVLRGLTIAFMVIVNTPGNWANLYAPLAHASWHGFTPTDLVFPTFLFVVGNAMSFAMKKLEEIPKKDFLQKIGKRTLLIFLIGWLLNAFPFYEPNEAGEWMFVDLSRVRFFGVLQRIGLSYFFAAIILYIGGIRLGWIFSILTLLLYWPILYFGGDAGDPYGLIGNAAIRLDLLIIGADNMYMGEGIAFDPEGILSTLTSVVNVIAGYLVGKMIQTKGSKSTTVRNLLAIGAVLILTSYVWDLAFPINKKIWTSPYVLVTVGWDLILLSGLLWVIEIQKLIKWTYFFQVFGRNPLVLYVLSGLVISVISMVPVGDGNLRGVIYEAAFTSWLNPKNSSFLFAICYMLLIWLIGFWMDKKRIYIKV